MRLERFGRNDKKLLGEGIEKEVFVNPHNEEKVVAVIKEDNGLEKPSARKLKAAFYLTKIAHILVPQHIPDIYQAGETKDGQQTFDRQYIKHTSAHSALQEAQQKGIQLSKDSEDAVLEETKNFTDVVDALNEIGFGDDMVDRQNMGNFLKADGNLYYLETFTPWELIIYPSHEEIRLTFDEQDLRSAVAQLSDPHERASCNTYLERLLALHAEEVELSKK